MDLNFGDEDEKVSPRSEDNMKVEDYQMDLLNKD